MSTAADATDLVQIFNKKCINRSTRGMLTMVRTHKYLKHKHHCTARCIAAIVRKLNIEVNEAACIHDCGVRHGLISVNGAKHTEEHC